MDTLKNIGRWIAFLPSWLGGMVIGAVVVNLFFLIQGWLTGEMHEGAWYKITNYGVSSFAGGFLSIYWGTKVAPNYKKIVSILLLVLTVLLAGFNFMWNFTYHTEVAIGWHILSSASLMLGAGYIMYLIFEEGEDYNPFE